jgi:hypothetical protein
MKHYDWLSCVERQVNDNELKKEFSDISSDRVLNENISEQSVTII